MTRELVDAAERELARRELARRHFVNFVPYIYQGTYLMGWFHRLLCNKLEQFYLDVKVGKCPRLIITAPPRSGKSELFSRMFPAYCLGKDPDFNFIACSFSPDLAQRMNRDVQRNIDSDQYKLLFPSTSLNGKRVVADSKGSYVRNTKEFEIVTHKGSYRASGVGSPINGMGADILLIDDPFKDRATAESDTLRNKIHDWFTSTAMTRLSPVGGIIIGNTRWHVDDLSGRILKKMVDGGEHYDVINFPAIAEHDEYDGTTLLRRAGEALHPERYPLSRLETIRDAIGDRDWNSLYQQKPMTPGGNLFKGEWFRYYRLAELPSDFDEVIVSWDLTLKNSPTSDFVAGEAWGKKDEKIYFLDLINERCSFTESLDLFALLCSKFPKAFAKLIEDKANGSAAIDVLGKKGFSGIIPVNPIGSKEMRANRITPFFKAGNVLFPDPSCAPWIGKFVRQVTLFPNDEHDDMVDSMTQALDHLGSMAIQNWKGIYG